MLLDSGAFMHDNIGILEHITVIEWCWTIWQIYIHYAEEKEGQLSQTHYADWALGDACDISKHIMVERR